MAISHNVDSQDSLKRVLTLPLITLYGVGGIIGAGIYVLIGKIAAVSGLLAPLAFMVAASIALFSALSYGELSSRFPSSGGEVTFVQRGFQRKLLSLLVGLAICFGGIVSSAAIARGSTGYLLLYVDASTLLLLVMFVGAIASLACWGVLESVLFAAVVTVIEIGGLVLICIVGAPNLPELAVDSEQLLPGLDWQDWAAIFAGALLAFYAYIGFEDMVNMGDEVVNPQRTMPAAILLALAISTLLYIVVALVFISSVPLEVLGSTDAPFAEIISRHSTIPTGFIGIISLLAISNGALVQIIMSSRILFGMSRQQMFPGWFGRVNHRTRTPLNATLVVSALVLSFAIALPVESLARLTSYILLSVFALVNLSLLKIKLRENASDDPVHGESQKEDEDYFVVPTYVPALGFALCAAFLLVQLL